MKWEPNQAQKDLLKKTSRIIAVQFRRKVLQTERDYFFINTSPVLKEMPMKWTKKKPTVTGYYWLKAYSTYLHKDKGIEKLGDPEIVSVDLGWFKPEELEITEMGDECGMGRVSDLDEKSLWHGPITPPEEDNNGTD